MDYNVDHVFLHDADVGGGVHRLRGTKHDVGELRAHHGAAPAVGQAAAQSLTDESLGEGGAAHMSHVQSRGDFPVDGPGLDLGLGPQLLRVLGSPLQEALGAEGFAVFQQADLSHFVGQSVNILALGFKAPLLGDADELLRVFDLVVAALFGLVQGVHDLTAVVGVGGGAAGGEAQEVPAHDTVDVAAADAPGALRRDAAGAHGADPAAGTGFAKAAMGGLILDPLLPGVGAYLLAVFQQRGSGRFHFFNSD